METCRASGPPRRVLPPPCLPLAVALLLTAGCRAGGDDADQAMRRYTDSLTRIHRLLTTVDDEASYLRAKPELARLWRESEQRHLRFGTEFSLEDVSPAVQAESEAADEAITRELERISSTHQEVARQILQLNQSVQDEVFMELE